MFAIDGAGVPSVGFTVLARNSLRNPAPLLCQSLRLGRLLFCSSPWCAWPQQQQQVQRNAVLQSNDMSHV